jgi:prepilin-type N-terminal cleavage/methylation domain-containing protein
MFFKKNKKGFTLIELLVVIAIIGILATIVLVSLNTARQKARDARRSSDVRQIALAMEMYYDSQSTVAYPTNAGATPIPAAIKTALAAYFSGGVPDDPLGSIRGYIWLDNTADAQNYCVYSAPETTGGRYTVASKAGVGTRNAVPTTLATCIGN